MNLIKELGALSIHGNETPTYFKNVNSTAPTHFFSFIFYPFSSIHYLNQTSFCFRYYTFKSLSGVIRVPLFGNPWVGGANSG